VRVALGGVDNTVRNGMSGGWSKGFSLSSAGTVSITLRYRLVHSGDFEPDECSEVLVAVDGALVSDGPNEFLARYCGLGDGNPAQDTGWRQAVVEVALGAGSHTVTVGGYLNKKTYFNEVTDIYFDEILITTDVILPEYETHCSDGIDNDGDGLTDCEDPDCWGDPVCSDPVTLVWASFDSSSDGFAYGDDTFRGTSQPAYASGNYAATGGYSGGGVRVALGGVDNTVRNRMSGGLSTTFLVNYDDVVLVTLRYRLVHAGDFEPDECSEVLVQWMGRWSATVLMSIWRSTAVWGWESGPGHRVAAGVD
jgi:hypothetical protein